MQANVKSEMPYRGVMAPVRRKVCNQILRQHRLPDEQSWRDTVLDLWDNATRAMKVLSERERHILVQRRLKDTPATLQDLSRHYGISRERVRQIEVRAFQKLQKSVKNAIIEQRIAS